MCEKTIVARANEVISGSRIEMEEAKGLIGKLKASFDFGLAGKVLTRLTGTVGKDTWYKQQLALCTYKDEELPPSTRFAQALAILEKIGLRDPGNKNAETLALGGAIYKRMWEFDGQLENLYEALAFYRAAHDRNPGDDLGYGGANAAYILDLLAARTLAVATRCGTDAGEAGSFTGQARELREAIAAQLAALVEKEPSRKEHNWFVVTMAEAFFGLGNHTEAGRWLAISAAMEGVSDWERQTTFRQLVGIARAQRIALPDEKSDPETWHGAWRALRNLMGDGTKAALSCYRGKVGLALSGGGFRASFYHLGVLARLAEMDVLRSVEVLSTVSGGSIVGAHYYLEVKKLLAGTPDGEISRRDYIEIVRRIQEDFLAGVQRNLRALALGDFEKNLRMILSENYGRSHRLGEMYEELLYARVQDRGASRRCPPRRMRDLLIRPEGAGEEFKPKFDNWKRRAKVPALLLNTTSLNTGHNWRFTARSMGEPPGLLGGEVDKNARYRRLWYEQAPTEELKNYRLGHAVAASAGVPGLFDPLALEGLYEGRTVRLVDGGVHDNQGVAGLLDEGCSFVLVSDASGQMQDKKAPSDGIPAVLLRSNEIVMDRVREAEYESLRVRLNSRALQGLFFVHLKKDLDVGVQDWIGCQDPAEKVRPGDGGTPYGIDRKIQELIAGIRTDLDSFTDVEAHALMASGYLMTDQQFRELQDLHEKEGEAGNWGGFPVTAPRGEWAFLRLAPVMAPANGEDPVRKELVKQLEAGTHRAFKIWRLNPWLRAARWVIGIVAVLALCALIRVFWGCSMNFNIGSVILGLTLAALTLAFPILKWAFPEKAARGVALRVFTAFFGYFAAKIHLGIFDRMFLAQGKLNRLLDQGKK